MPKTIAERTDLLPTLGEIFREHGYEGASLAIICRRTGLGKGSLYNFFPGGKEEMASAVLAEIDVWFETNVFVPLLENPEPARAIATTFDATETYFRSGRRVCLVGVFALDETRDRFGSKVQSYFSRWADALTSAIARAGMPPDHAKILSEEALAAIQGGLVMARALNDPGVFQRVIERAKTRLVNAHGQS